MFDLVGQIIESWMTIDLVLGGLVQFGSGIGRRGLDVFTLYDPNTDALTAACIHVSCIFDGHIGIGRMQAAYMLMFQALFASDEHLL